MERRDKPCRHTKKPYSKTDDKVLTRLFNIGDIVAARIQWAGCSYHTIFGRVCKITNTGRYTVQLIGDVEDKDHKESTKRTPGVLQPIIDVVVRPDLEDNDRCGKKICTNREGRFERGARFGFELYDKNCVYKYSSNLGD